MDNRDKVKAIHPWANVLEKDGRFFIFSDFSRTDATYLGCGKTRPLAWENATQKLSL